ncbi:MAG: phosphate ABC transporter permease PstA [Alphaproteobacteria bacterium]
MIDQTTKSFHRRHWRDRVFRRVAVGCVGFALLALLTLLSSIISQGWGAFVSYSVEIQAQDIPPNLPSSDRAAVVAIITSFLQTPVTSKQDVIRLFSADAGSQLVAWLKQPQGPLRLTLSDDADMVLKHSYQDSPLKPEQRKILNNLRDLGVVRQHFNLNFFTAGDSREPELVGIYSALVGSLLTLATAFVMAFPIGVMTAIYLTEYAKPSVWRTWVEININNLAAVPSIVFGLLGLSLFIQFLGWPRSTPLVGGAVLALIILPTLVIATTAALKSVPTSIRMAALAMGASKTQMVFHHVVPYSIPGIMTGSILSMAHILGETAPLLLIGMVAFIVDVPGGITEAATTLPVQIFLWSESPERAFAEKTAGAILVLLVFLLIMNALAIILRHRHQKTWS